MSKVVITVPAFFNDGQRQATRQAGELAGLEVVRIINEPTAAVLTYDPHPPEMERLLVYDLGGGTFDVSVAQVENGVVEIQASHGDTQLGGDDFDQLLLDHVCDAFATNTASTCRQSPASKARVLRAAEDAKKRLSFDAVTTIEEEFITEKNGKSLNLVMEIARYDYEELIRPLLLKTLDLPGRGPHRRQGAGATRSTRSSWWEEPLAPRWCTHCSRNGWDARSIARSSPTWPSPWGRPCRAA